MSDNELFPVSDAWASRAFADNEKYLSMYQQSVNDPDGFWREQGKRIDWFKPYTKVKNTTYGPGDVAIKWYEDGTLNAAHNCLDRHLDTRGDQTAIIWEGDDPADSKTFTYKELHREVCRFANGLKALGAKKGDRVTIYLPMIPEIAVAVLACARIGAIHSVVFGGFSPDALAGRIQDCDSNLIITSDGGMRGGKAIPLKANTDAAIAQCPSIQHCVVVNRTGGDINFAPGRDVWYHDLMADQSADCPAVEMGAEDPLFILYTSGSTGKPKGVLHTTGGYMVYASMTHQYVFDYHDGDIYWCTADVGWVTGHSYIVYGPLANGATVLMYEGGPDWPEKDRFWDLCEKYGVTIFYTAPTAIRAFMKWGEEWPDKHDLSKLRLLGSVGEPINPEAWMWYHRVLGKERCPIVDTWWQTETGAIMITPLPAVTETRPGSATHPFPGISVTLLDDVGTETKAGFLAITEPWPSMLRTIYGDDERYQETYWSKWDGIYFPGDGAKLDDDGYLWLLGRVDDVLSVAGHRIGTMEVESALVDHPAVVEAAVVGQSHDVKGEVVAAFVTLKEGQEGSDDLVVELKKHVVEKIGAIARPQMVIFAADLPKTRSGKIMRRLLKDVAEGKALGDMTTLADPTVVDQLKAQYEAEEG